MFATHGYIFNDAEILQDAFNNVDKDLQNHYTQTYTYLKQVIKGRNGVKQELHDRIGQNIKDRLLESWKNVNDKRKEAIEKLIKKEKKPEL